MKQFFNTVWRHSTVWVVFISYEVSITVILKVNLPWYHYAIFYALNIILFYLNAYLLMRIDRKYQPSLVVAVPAVIIELVLYVLLMILATTMLGQGSELKMPWSYGVLKIVYRGSFFIGLSWGYFQHRKALSQQAEKYALKLSQVEMTQRNLELHAAQLQAQLNPHLLYNAIQLLNAELKPEQARAKQVVKYMTQVFRYASTKTDENGEIPLSAELEQVENFVSLQQYLHAFTLKVELNILKDASLDVCNIAPLLLMTFVENVFKYGDLTGSDKPAVINISCNNRVITLRIFNKKKQTFVNSTGVGLHNVNGLLKTKYKDHNPELTIVEDQTQYVTSLSMKL